MQGRKKEEQKGEKERNRAYKQLCSIFISSFKKTSPSSTSKWLISGPSWYGVMTLLSIAGICRIKMSLFKYKIFKDLKYR
jgi:hypothetical protein